MKKVSKEKKAKIKKALKIAGACAGTSLLSFLFYKLGQKSVDSDKIIANFIGKTATDEYNKTIEHVYEIHGANKTVYAKWNVFDERPDWLDDPDTNRHDYM